MKWKTLNIANRITLIRLFLIPLVLLFMLLPTSSLYIDFLGDGFFYTIFSLISISISLFLFSLASLTDYLDGHLARKYNMVTVLGKFLDPIVDKMLILAIWIAFVQLGKMNAIIPVIVLLREFLVTGIRLIAAEKGQVLSAQFAGKLKTVLQIIATIFLYIDLIFYQATYFSSEFLKLAYTIHYLANITLFLSIIAAIFSAWIYIRQSKNLFLEDENL